MKKVFNEIATVISNKCIAKNIYETHFYSPNISQNSKPGQFVNILPSTFLSFLHQLMVINVVIQHPILSIKYINIIVIPLKHIQNP